MSSFQRRRLKQKTDPRVECRDSSPVKDIFKAIYTPVCFPHSVISLSKAFTL